MDELPCCILQFPQHGGVLHMLRPTRHLRVLPQGQRGQQQGADVRRRSAVVIGRCVTYDVLRSQFGRLNELN